MVLVLTHGAAAERVSGRCQGWNMCQGNESPVNAEKAWTLVVLVLSGCQGGAKDGAVFLEPEPSSAPSHHSHYRYILSEDTVLVTAAFSSVPAGT